MQQTVFSEHSPSNSVLHCKRKPIKKKSDNLLSPHSYHLLFLTYSDNDIFNTAYTALPQPSLHELKLFPKLNIFSPSLPSTLY